MATARARRQIMPGFILQARRRQPDENATPATIRVGFTCSKKLGNAVTRNRAKRRLRAAVREVLPHAGRPGWDYVLVGRPGATVALPFAALTADLHAALARMAAPPRRSAGTGPGRESGQAVSTGAETGS